MTRRPLTSVAAELRDALHHDDLQQLWAVLHPDVHWAAAGPAAAPRVGRAEAMRWYQDRYDQGVRTQAEETISLPAAIVLALRVSVPETARTSEPGGLYYRVCHLAHDRITHIRDYQDRVQALEAATAPAAVPAAAPAPA